MISQKLQRLARAMAQHEGWGFSGSRALDYSSERVAYRNHNPGNLRFSPFMLGQRDGFAVFIDDQIGYFALLYDLRIKCTGQSKSGLTGENTVADMLGKYAPSSENDVDAYIKAVVLYSGIPSSTKLKEFVTL